MTARPSIRLLSADQVRSIHDTSLQLLGKVGVRVHHETVLRRLADAGAMVETNGVARFPESMVMQYVRRVVRGFDVTPCTLATEIIAGVGPGGNFLAEEHTAANFRNEIWLCDSLWSRSLAGTGDDSSMTQRLSDRVTQILADQTPTPMDPAMAKEIDRVVRAAGDGAFGS